MRRMDEQPVVLLTEPVALVGMDLSDALEKSGYRVLGPLATATEALNVLERETPTLAIVDIMLRDGPCPELAQELRRRRVPFLVHTGCYPDEPLADAFQGAVWLNKPALPDDVVALCDELSLIGPEPVTDMPNTQTISSSGSIEPANASLNPFVRKLAGFAALSNVDRAVLERISAQARLVGPRTDLVREGDKPGGVFLIMKGMACRHKLRASGARQIMAYLVPGDLCDLDVALLNEMDHSITTLSACEVVYLTPKTIAGLLKHHPQVARALRMTTLVDEATLREWLMNVGCRSALERIAHLFCELLVRLQAVGCASQDGYDLPATQQDLADTTGLSTVHVNRTLQELRRLELIAFKGRRLTLLNLPQLRALAEFKPNYLHLGDRAAA